MNTDIRLGLGFWQHPKTKKTIRRLGLEGVRSVQVLWLWAAAHKPDGMLAGMDWEDIELAADWQGEERAFFTLCLGLWIDETPHGYALHDWPEHNPWQAEARARSEKARKAAKARWERNETQDEAEHTAAAHGAPPEEAAKAHAPAWRGQCPSPLPAQPVQTVLKPPHASPHAPAGNRAQGTPAGQGQRGETPQAQAEEGARPLTAAQGRGTRQTQQTPPAARTSSQADKKLPHAEGRSQRGRSPSPSQEPGLEFIELRNYYSAHARPEAPLSGFSEYKQLRASRQWPGQSALYDGIDALSGQDAQWQRGFAPGLARFLRERIWETPPQAPCAAPVAAQTQHQADRQNMIQLAQFVRRADAARQSQEESHANHAMPCHGTGAHGRALPPANERG